MYFEEHFFWRHQEQLKAEEAEFDLENVLEREEDAEFTSFVRQSLQRCFRLNRNQKKIQKYYQLAGVAYNLAQSQHYDITVADGRDVKGEIRFRTDGLVFSSDRFYEDKEAFLELLSESDLFFLEPDDEYIQMTFYFDLCGPEGQKAFSMEGFELPSEMEQ